MLNYKGFHQCQLCPRNCRVDRTKVNNAHLGYCGQTAKLRVAAIEAHFGEEPPISGTNGSGTVFFTGCSLKCIFCQNYQISHQKLARYNTIANVVDRIERLVVNDKIHNINFVTPDHFFPHIIEIVASLRGRGIQLPTVFNVSGYQRIESLQQIAPVVDIYLPDYKYSDSKLAKTLSHCEDYPDLALEAISEMLQQKGFLDSFSQKADVTDTIAKRGVLVRHLILPGQVQNSLDALTTLYLEFGKELPLSIMSQYCPVRSSSLEFLNRKISRHEFEQVYDHVLQLGFKNLFVQFPETDDTTPLFTPDFQQEHPFIGNRKI